MSRALGSISTLAKGLMLHGNVRVIALTSLVTGIYVSLLNASLQPFVVDTLGFGVATLAILVSAGSRPSGLASSLVQPVAGYVADIFGRKKLVVLGSAIAVASMLSFLLSAATHSLFFLSLGYLLFGLSMLGSPASQAMVAESVAANPGRMQVAFSVVFFFTQLPAALIPFAAVLLTSSLGYYWIFAGSALLETMNLVSLISFLKETHPGVASIQSGPARVSLGEIFRLPAGFAKLYTPIAMDSFFFGVAGSIIYGIWSEAFGFTVGDIGLIVGTLSLAVVIWQYPAAKLLLKVGPRKSLAFSEVLTVVVMVGWDLSRSLPVYLVLAVVFGASVATWVPALQSLLMIRSPPEKRAGIGGKLAAFRGLMAFPAPIIGGLLFNSYGYYAPVTLGALGEMATTLSILALIPET